MAPINLDALIAAVTESTTVGASAVALIEGFSTKITAAVVAALKADDAADQGTIEIAEAAIAKATAEMVASSAKLGAAITANTPAPAPTPEPAPAPAPAPEPEPVPAGDSTPRGMKRGH